MFATVKDMQGSVVFVMQELAVRLTTESGVFALPVWEGLVSQVLAVRGKTALQFAVGKCHHLYRRESVPTDAPCDNAKYVLPELASEIIKSGSLTVRF